MAEPEKSEAIEQAPSGPTVSPVRSMFAVLGGIVSYVLLLVLFMTMVGSIFPDLYPATEAGGEQTTAGLLLGLLGELINGAAAGLLAGRIAGRSPLAHAGALAGVLGLFAMASMDQVRGMPGWFALGFAACAPLGVLIGGLVAQRVVSKQQQPRPA